MDLTKSGGKNYVPNCSNYVPNCSRGPLFTYLIAEITYLIAEAYQIKRYSSIVWVVSKIWEILRESFRDSLLRKQPPLRGACFF